MWPPEKRGKALSIYTAGPLLGPALGPVGKFCYTKLSIQILILHHSWWLDSGAYNLALGILEHNNLQWVCPVVRSLGLARNVQSPSHVVFYRHTNSNNSYAPKILQRKAEALRKETGNMALHTAFEENSEHTSILKKLEVALQRPFKLLGTQPVVQVVSLYMAFIYGVTYLVYVLSHPY